MKHQPNYDMRRAAIARPWPPTIGAARRLIEATFQKNRWDERDRRFYMNDKGVQPQLTAELTGDDCKVILAAMQKSRMIIFEETAREAA